MSHFSVALELCYIFPGEPCGFCDHPQQRSTTPAFTPGYKSPVSDGGDSKQKHESRATSSSPPHWLISLKGDGQWGGSS